MMLWIGAIFVIFVSYVRIYFSVELTDEALYMAQPYAFSLGFKPYVEESAVYQGAALLLAPFFRLFTWATGGTQGIVLYARHLYFLVSLLTCVLVYRLYQRFVSTPLALLAAGFIFTFLPYSIPALSYNTLTEFCLLTGLCLMGLGGESQRPRALFFLATLIFGAIALSYPPLVLVVLLAIGALGLGVFPETLEPKRQSVRRGVLAGTAVGCVAALILLLSVGWQSLYRTFRFHASFGANGGGIEKFASILKGWSSSSYWLLVALFLLAALSAIRRAESGRLATGLSWLSVVFLAGLQVYLYFFAEQYHAAHVPHYTFPLLTIGILVYRWNDREPQSSSVRTARFLGLLSFLAGLAMSWASTNSLLSGVCGFMMASSLFFILTALRFPERPCRVLVAGFLIVAIGCQLFTQYQSIYRDDPFLKLRHRVPSGPFAGLYTTAEKAAFLLQIQEDLATVGKRAKSAFFFESFPAGYLMGAWRPRGASVIVPDTNFYSYDRMLYAGYYTSPERWPDLVVHMKSLMFDTKTRRVFRTFDPTDPLAGLFTAPRYALALDRAEYRIWVRETP